MAIPIDDSKPTPSEATRNRARKELRDAREQYRVHKQPTTSLEVTVTTADGRSAVGECIDLAVGGAGVAIARAKSLEIVEGAKVKVRVQHTGRAKGVEADAEVVTISNVGGTVRYGLRFTNIAKVVEQIDSFYARWFNRRRSARVMPDFTQKVSSAIRWSEGELQARIHDISMGGVGVLTTLDQITSLRLKTTVELALTLPGTPLPIVCRARVVGLKTFTKNVLVGLEFEPNGGIERYAAGLQRYIEERQRAIAKFNDAMSQSPKRAS